MYICNNICVLPQVGYSQSGSDDIHKSVRLVRINAKVNPLAPEFPFKF